MPLTPGTVTFELFGPDNATCQAPAVFTSDPIALTLDTWTGTAETTGFAPAQPGVYRWIATYSGDDVVPPNPAESTVCGDVLETQVVQAQPAIIDARDERDPRRGDLRHRHAHRPAKPRPPTAA